jgi:hypothetical protein
MHRAVVALLLAPCALAFAPPSSRAVFSHCGALGRRATGGGGEGESGATARLEDQVVDSIRAGVTAGVGRPRAALAAAGAAGNASGALLQTWLTPQRLEEAAVFWGDGTALLARDAARGRLRTLRDVSPIGWLGLLSVSPVRRRRPGPAARARRLLFFVVATHTTTARS